MSGKKRGAKNQPKGDSERRRGGEQYKVSNRFFAFPAFDSDSRTDPLGSYTGRPTQTYEVPEQDPDDL